MLKALFISNSKNRYPRAFITSLLCLVLFQIVLSNSQNFWRFCYHFSDPKFNDGIRFEAQINLLEDNSKKRILLTGSSQTREDFDVSLLNTETAALSFYNLGMSGSAQPIELYMLKDTLLQQHPSMIIYTVFLGSFYEAYDFRKLRYYFNPVIAQPMIRFLPRKDILKNKSYIIDSIIAKTSVLYRYRDSYYTIFINALKHYIGIAPMEHPRFFAYDENLSKEYFTKVLADTPRNKYSISSYTALNKYLFNLFARDVVNKRILFIVIDAPVHPLFSQLYSQAIYDDYHSFLRQQAHTYGFDLISESMPAFNESDFIDFLHLNAQGRNKLTLFLKNYLQEHVSTWGSR